MIKIISRVLLVLYLVILTWLVLFKLAFHISPILHLQHRSLNWIPFAAPSRINGRINYSELFYNLIFFVPFGLLLNVNFKKTRFFTKFVSILVFSFCVELIQYIFAIGASDITDIIMNTSGGAIGLILYSVVSKGISREKLDKFIIFVGVVLLIIFITLRSRVTIDFREKSYTHSIRTKGEDH